MADEDDWLGLSVDRGFGGRYIGFQRNRLVLDDGDLVTVLLQDLVDTFPPSGLPSFLYCTERLNEDRLIYQHFGEPLDERA